MVGMVQVALDPSAGQEAEDADSEARKKTCSDNLGQQLYGTWTEWADARRDIEIRWVEDLRAYNGLYDSETQTILDANKNRSKVFVRLTRTKTLSAFARIIDLLFQSGDKHWSIGPTPIPELTPFAKKKLVDMVTQSIRMMPPEQAAAMGVQVGEDGNVILSPQEMQTIANDLAKKRSVNMERQMEDQLVEADYNIKAKQSIMECCLLGSGAMKGVALRVEHTEQWAENEEGWDTTTVEKVLPDVTAPSVFDLYPDPHAIGMNDAVGIFERHVMTRSMIRDLESLEGFDKAAIQEVIEFYEKGNHTDLTHETDRRTIAGQSSVVESITPRYDVLEYWGQVTGADLESAGFKIAEDQRTIEFNANVWICGPRTLMCRLNPSKPARIPYHIFPYERVPHQFWGIGVPRQMRDSQEIVNAAWRATIDNMAISSGPQIEINMNLLVDGEDPRDIHPWREWLREGGDANAPLLRVHQIDSHLPELGNLLDNARRFVDEETSMPSYTHGEQMPGLNKTATGVSMLMGAANVQLKSVIKNIDDYLVKPLIQSLYHWNMQWTDNEEIKGDMKIEARGSTALLAKEIQSQRLVQFAGMTANPVDMSLMGPKRRASLMRSVARSMDIEPDEVYPDEDELPDNLQPPVPGGGGGGPVSGNDPAMGGAGGVPGAAA